MVTSVNEVLFDDFTRQSINLMRLEAGMRAKVLGAMKKLEMDLVAQLRGIDLNEVNATSYRMVRLQALLRQTRDTIRTAYRINRKLLSDNLTSIALNENVTTIGTLNAALGVDIATVAFPRSIALSLARDTLIEGAIPSEWWARQAAALQRSFSDQMTIGILAGETNNQLVRRIRGKATGKRRPYIIGDITRTVPEFSGGIMDVSTRQAQALVRTSTQAVAQDSRMETFRENKHIIKGVMASVTFDLRTTDLCKGRSGMSWDFEGKPLNSITTESYPGEPPWHWNCRTQLVAITKSWRELATKNKSKLKSSPKNLKASMDGQVSSDLTYSQWLKKQGKKEQQKALGIAKRELWKSGKINMRELVDQSGNSLSIDSLNVKN